MELVPGETLNGPFPLETALKYAKQIAEALEAAHDKGITHRDLKPANIMVTPAGVVKVLDFGLAAVTQPSASSGDPSHSPTLTMRATQAGMILGTAGYMAPEQAAGQPVDRRADIWAFGVVLYEMLTGQRLFSGDSIAHILADVLRAPIDFDKLPKETPRAIRELVKRCLDRDVKTRLQAIGEARIAIQNVGKEPEVTATTASTSRLSWLAWSLAVIGWAAALSLTAWMFLRPAPFPAITRFEIHAPDGSTLPLGTPAPSPDGRSIAYTVTGKDGIARIHVRPMDSTESRALPGTEDATHPFWSPDGRSLAFFAQESLKRIDLAGGSARALTQTPANVQGYWNQDGFILFSPDLVGLSRIPADGGVSAPAAKPDEKRGEDAVSFPYFLSDGKRFLVRVTHADGRTSIELASLESLQRTTVIPDAANAPILAPTPGGKTYLLYLRDTSLVAQEFDEASGKARGSAVVLVSEIGRVGQRGTRPTVGVSASGILAYQNGNFDSRGTVAWFDRSGKRLSQLPPTAGDSNPTLSPDGRFAAVGDAFSPNNSRGIQLVDLVRGVSRRFTFAPGSSWPVWSPDGKRVAFQSAPDGKPGIYVKDANGAGAEQLLAPVSGAPTSWSPDGQSILYTEHLQAFLLPLNGDKKPISAGFPNVYSQSQATISPDGKYLAFSAADSRGPNVYIQAMPPNVGKWQISVDGGMQPRWRRDGKELFFLSPDSRMMAVDVSLSATVTPGVPHELFQASAGIATGQRYDVSADGQRFLMYSLNRENAPITVVMNWWAGLKN